MAATAERPRELAPLDARLRKRGITDHFTRTALADERLAGGLLPGPELDGEMPGLAEMRARHRRAWDRALAASREAAEAGDAAAALDRRERELAVEAARDGREFEPPDREAERERLRVARVALDGALEHLADELAAVLAEAREREPSWRAALHVRRQEAEAVADRLREELRRAEGLATAVGAAVAWCERAAGTGPVPQHLVPFEHAAAYAVRGREELLRRQQMPGAAALGPVEVLAEPPAAPEDPLLHDGPLEGEGSEEGIVAFGAAIGTTAGTGGP